MCFMKVPQFGIFWSNRLLFGKQETWIWIYEHTVNVTHISDTAQRKHPWCNQLSLQSDGLHKVLYKVFPMNSLAPFLYFFTLGRYKHVLQKHVGSKVNIFVNLYVCIFNKYKLRYRNEITPSVNDASKMLGRKLKNHKFNINSTKTFCSYTNYY